jgi:tRNA (guanine37-N1)-methyltransferase
MRIDVLTLFPEMFESPLSYSILKRAQQQNIVQIALSNIRDFAPDRYHKVDDAPYGGGAGMVMMCQPVFDCLEHVRPQSPELGKVVLMCPQGTPFSQDKASELAKEKRLILITGRYEGFDERIRTGLNAEAISIGDYVLSGGELGAMVVIDAVVRLLQGALGDDTSAHDESFTDGLLEYPHYTRPEDYRGMKVPPILLGGNHAKIAEWRLEQRIERTKRQRPDLWAKYLERKSEQQNNKNNND